MDIAEESADRFAAGVRVALKTNPGRVGILTGRIDTGRARPRYEVQFIGDPIPEFVPALALDVLGSQLPSLSERIAGSRYESVAALRASITYYRLRGRLSDVIYSLNATNTDFYSWQFKPVLSFVDSPVRGLLIADEVGLGKTIEAGLIWTELRTREDARRLLVMCPAMLREKWQWELQERFRIRAEICNAEEVLRHLKEAELDPLHSFSLIASLQGLRAAVESVDEGEGPDDTRHGSEGLGRFLARRRFDDPLVDLVVVDEAHYLRNPETQTARFARLLRPSASGLVLLSATPIQMRSADLFNLLNLIDSQTFGDVGSFDEILAENEPLVRLRDELLSQRRIDAGQFEAALRGLAASRKLATSRVIDRMLEDSWDDESLAGPATRARLAERLDRASPLSKVVCRTRKRDVQERRVKRLVSALRCRPGPVERELYEAVTERVRDYCSGLSAGEGFLLTIPQRQLCSSMPAALSAWQGLTGDSEVDDIVAEVFADLDLLQQGQSSRPSVRPLVEQLARIAREVGDYDEVRRSDTKFTKLSSALRDYWTKFPDGKVVLFAYFKETLRYLQDRLGREGIRTVLLFGGMDKGAALRDFEAEGGPRVLLASEVASEGIDLQFASVVVNYDLPWNPMRIEQRIGRIDRLGQKADAILVWNFFYEETLDDRVYTRLFERLNIFESALGSAEAVLGESIRDLSLELLRHHLTPAEEAAAVERTRLVIEQNAIRERQLEEDAGRLVAHGSYLLARIEAARNLQRYITGQDLLMYVSEFFRTHYPGSQFERVHGDGLVVDVDLSAAGRIDLESFLDKTRQTGLTRLASRVVGRVRCRFDNLLGVAPRGVELISQTHPAVQFVTASLGSEDKARPPALVALALPEQSAGGVPPGRYAFAVQKWTFSGERQVEKLAYVAIDLSGQKVMLPDEHAELLATRGAAQGSDWLNAAADVYAEQACDRINACVDLLEDRFAEFADYMSLENEDRIGLQVELARKHGAERETELLARIERFRVDRKLKAAGLFEAQLAKHRQRTEEKMLRLQARRQTTHESRLVAAGVVRVD